MGTGSNFHSTHLITPELFAQHANCETFIEAQFISLFSFSEDLSKLHYTTCFIKESLRVVPPVPVFNRQLKEQVVFEGVSIPANTIVDVSPYCLHHHPDVWDKPHVRRISYYIPKLNIYLLYTNGFFFLF